MNAVTLLGIGATGYFAWRAYDSYRAAMDWESMRNNYDKIEPQSTNPARRAEMGRYNERINESMSSATYSGAAAVGAAVLTYYIW